MNFSPRPYQEVAIKRMVDSPYQLLALRMGAGKTAATLMAVDQLMQAGSITKTLVVAPKRVTELVWHTEAAKWDQLAHLRVQKVVGSLNQRIAALAQPADVYVINRENFVWLTEHLGANWRFDCVVIDENRGFKDRSSRSWQALKRLRDSIKRLYILTGTPTPNGLMELWPQISILDRGQRLGRSLTFYRNEYFVPEKRNGPVVYSWRLKPGAEQAIHDAVADVMLALDGDQQLPDRIDNIVPVHFDMARYRELANDMISGDVVALSAGVLAGKLGQIANGAVYNVDGVVETVHDAKLDALEEIVEQGEPVLCLTAYRHDQARIRQRFPNAKVFDGAQSLAAWQRGEIELLLMHPASGGHGVDGLQLGGSVVVWFGLPFSLDLYEQANARLHRSGQQNNVVVHHLVSQGTIDERIMRVLASKGDMQQALLDAVNELKGETCDATE